MPAPMSPPVCETPRLILRGVRPEDEVALYGLLSDRRVVRYMLFPLCTREMAGRFIARFQAPPAEGERSQLVLAITRRADAAVIGLCGLVVRPEAEEAEVWYLLRPDAWGQGLITEAVGALVDHGFGPLALHRIWASCLPENPASARVLDKLGFRREGLLRQNLRIQGEWKDSYLYGLLASEWVAARGGENPGP